jgi:2-hydroxychromene-2-carboxylate isomerase
MAANQIDFWVTMGSTYSYLSVMRLVELERSSRIPFRWRPFHLRFILDEMKHIPFADKLKKSAYMWRDVERRAAMYGVLIRLPAPYPAKQSIMANLIAIVGMREGWVWILSARPIVDGCSLARRPEANPMFREACATLVRSRSLYLH